MSDNEDTHLVDMVNSALQHTIPAVHRMGVRAVEVRKGYARTSVPFEGNGNHFGVMYAGVLFSVAEVLGGVLALSSFDAARFYPLVKDAQITFKRAASTDVTATASLTDETIAAVAAAADRDGKADFTFEAELTDTDGTVVAVTRNVCQLRKHAS